MITKKVNRYYCEHCDKGGGSAGHMRRHEGRCTLNPQRVCGMCSFAGFDPKPLAELVALLPDPQEYKQHDEDEACYCDSYVEAIKAAWPALEGAADTCPVCMLAAVRQAGVPDGFLNSCSFFDYKKAVDELFAERNEAKIEAEMRASQHG